MQHTKKKRECKSPTFTTRYLRITLVVLSKDTKMQFSAFAKIIELSLTIMKLL